MDPLGAASAIAPLVVKAFTLSQQVYTTISQITNAPKHIKAISNDLEDFYIVLGTLKGYLEDEDLSQCVLHPSASDSLESVLENSVNIFTELSGMILVYKARGGFGDITKWRSIKYTFMSAEVDKAEISAHMRELEDKLPLISQQVKDLQVAELPQGSPHSLTDRKLLLYDHDYTLRKYFESAASIISSRAPSMRISSLGSRERSSAPTSSAYRTNGFLEVRLKHIADITDITEDTTIFSVKEMLHDKIGILPHSQELFMGGRKLSNWWTLRHCRYWREGRATMALSAASTTGYSGESLASSIMPKLSKPSGVIYYLKLKRSLSFLRVLLGPGSRESQVYGN
ncbi:uncharacterized protein PAC_11241 [Phialocephala subalpina]|uniref:Ubiquitin-like domain-containing protein n=1 Tax=Phialocephala subalpina TaxID=576137 RepID=A0A1L7X8H9_9HELO|nr:uncharacterized protein PAC_11241 [Phialocephala subalpina]